MRRLADERDGRFRCEWLRRLPNDVRIDCKAAKHSDGDRGAVLAHLEAELREPRRPPSVDCSSRPTGRRANKRRFVNLLQQLASALEPLSLGRHTAKDTPPLGRTSIKPVTKWMKPC